MVWHRIGKTANCQAYRDDKEKQHRGGEVEDNWGSDR